MTGIIPRDFDALLAHADWVQRLSGQLCRDQHAAADAAQETWLQALRRPPGPGGSVRGFFATVLHNVVRMRGRSDRRVERRERAAADRNDLAESAADACARAELQQFVVREVLALPEPQKALVLLHYFEGCDVAELARGHGMSADAVRSHLRRARDTLRLRLQSKDGPARRAFGALLLGHTTSAPWLLVGATMATLMKTKLVSAAAVVAIAAWAFWQFAVPPVEPTRSTGTVATAVDPDRAAVHGTSTETATGNVHSADEGTVQRTAASMPDSPRRLVRCQLVGLRERMPWTAAIHVRLFVGKEPRGALLESPDTHGVFAIVVPAGMPDGIAARFTAEDPNYADLDVMADLAVTSHRADPYELVVQPLATIVGTVVDHRGKPVKVARISAFAWVAGRPRAPRVDSMPNGVSGGFVLRPPMQGELFLVALAMEHVEVVRRVAVFGGVRNDLLPATARVRSVFGAETDAGVMMLAQPAMITGEVRDPQGRPVADERVYWYPGESSEVDLELDREVHLVGGTWNEPMLAGATKTDAQGRFRLPGRAGAQGWLHLMNGRDYRYEPFVGYRDVRAPADVTIQLGGNTAVVRVLRGGKPVPNVTIRPEPPGESTASVTDERGEVRLLREHAKVQQLSLRGVGPLPIAIELPLDTAPDRAIVIELGDDPGAPVVFDVTSAFPVEQFGAVLHKIGGAKREQTSMRAVRDPASGEIRGHIAPGDYRLEVWWSKQGGDNDRFVLRQTQTVLVPASGVRIPLVLQHGGRLRIQARDRDGLQLAGVITLRGTGGTEEKPRLDAASGDDLVDGRLPGNGPVVTYSALAPGSWEVTLDLGARGVHRRTVEVRACEIAEVDGTVQ